MSNYMNAKLHQRGVVLMMTLFFVLLLAMMIMNALETALLEVKMSNNFTQQLATFNAALTKLINAETKLAQGGKVASAEIISTAICGVTIYRIIASATQGSTKTEMQSTFAKVGDTSHCDPKPKMVTGRQSWRLTS